MRRLRNFYLVVAVLALLCIGQEASAQAYISPPVGIASNVANTWTAQQTFALEDAGTTTTLYPIQLVRTSTGTPTTIGVGEQYALENGSAANKVAASLDVAWTDATAASEDAAVSFNLMTAGAAVASAFAATGALFFLPAASAYGWLGRARLLSPVDGVVTVTSSAAAGGYLQNTGGDTVLASTVTNVTTTFANTAFSRTIINGRSYAFDMSLQMTTATTTDGAKLDFNGGSATVSGIIVTCLLSSNVGAVGAQVAAGSTSLAGVINATDFLSTSRHLYECHGSLTASSTGTFIPRFAKNDDAAGATLSLFQGSSLLMSDVITQ